MMEKVKHDLGVRMNFTNALDHVPEEERNNRTMQFFYDQHLIRRVAMNYLTNLKSSHYESESIPNPCH
jgi:hypothetical protein